MKNRDKKHIVSIWQDGKRHFVLVKGAQFDGKHYRISSTTWAEIQRTLNVRRGACIGIGC